MTNPLFVSKRHLRRIPKQKLITFPVRTVRKIVRGNWLHQHGFTIEKDTHRIIAHIITALSPCKHIAPCLDFLFPSLLFTLFSSPSLPSTHSILSRLSLCVSLLSVSLYFLSRSPCHLLCIHMACECAFREYLLLSVSMYWWWPGICPACADHCHRRKGHNVRPYLLQHIPTWACCYCLKTKQCKLTNTS